MASVEKFDLHTHTNHSDGMYSPEALVELAAERELSGIGITDHDEIGGLEAAIACGKEHGLEIIPGVELSSFHGPQEVHILGYFIDYSHQPLLDTLTAFQQQRRKRAIRILQRLNELGINLPIGVVDEVAINNCVGRPHIAHALVREGFVNSYQDAFNSFLAEGKPAFVPKPFLSPADAIEIIHGAGGVAILAHPGQNLRSDTVVEILKLGVDGIEVIHPKHTNAKRETYQELALKNRLLQTGGSDFHGGAKALDRFGRFFVSGEQVELLRNLAQRRQKQWA